MVCDKTQVPEHYSELQSYHRCLKSRYRAPNNTEAIKSCKMRYSLYKEEEKYRGNCIRQNFSHSTATDILRKLQFSYNTRSTQESHCHSIGTYSSPQLIDLLTAMQQTCRMWCPFQFMIARIGLSGFELFRREWLLAIYTDNFLLSLYQCKLL